MKYLVLKGINMSQAPQKPEPPSSNFHLIENDFVYRLIERRSVPAVWLTAMLIYCVTDIVVGLSTDHFFGGENYVSIREVGEIVSSINVWVVFLPMVWLLYRWLPVTAYESARSLEEQQLIIGAQDELNFKPLSQRIQTAISAPWIYGLALLGMLLSTLIFNLYGVPMATQSVGRVNFWFYTPLSTLIFNLLYVPSNYVLFLMAFRQVSTARTLSAFFKEPACIKKVYPLHPDGSGGFAGIGRLITRTAFAVVVILVWMLVYSYYPVLLGGSPDWTVIWLVYLVYVVVVPLVLIGPLWSPHRAMVVYKSIQLKKISEEIYEGYSQSLNHVKADGLLQTPSNLERIDRLVALYESLNKNIPVWPIAVRSIRNISITAVSPLVFSLLPVIIDFVRLVGQQP